MKLSIVIAVLVTGACTRPATGGVLRPAARLAEPRASHSATALPDGTLLVAGGFRKAADGTSQRYTATTEIVDPIAGTVKAGPALATARAGHSATTLGDGRVLLAGGWNAGGMLRSAELYDPATGTVTAVGAELGEARGGFTATALADGRVLFCGGGDGAGSPTAELYDPADGRFHPTGAMATGRIGHTATLLADGRVLVVGGAAGRGRVLASAEIYDPASGAFTAAGAPAIERYKHAAIRLRDGRVLVAGGTDARDWTGAYATTEIYDPATDRFTAGPTLTTQRFKLGDAIELVGDTVAIAGGARTIEVVDPDGARPSHVVARLGRTSYVGTATTVGDRLVVVGGYDEQIRASRDVWVLDRAAVTKPAS